MSLFKNKPSGGGNFIKFPKDGSPIEGVMRGQIIELYEYFDPATKKSRPAQDSDTENVSWRFISNFVVVENGALIAKILKGGKALADSIDAMMKAGYDLQKTKLQITRTGTGFQTKYSVVVPPNGQLSDAQVEKLAGVALNPIMDPETAPTELATEGDIPF